MNKGRPEDLAEEVFYLGEDREALKKYKDKRKAQGLRPIIISPRSYRTGCYILVIGNLKEAEIEGEQPMGFGYTLVTFKEEGYIFVRTERAAIAIANQLLKQEKKNDN